MDIKRGSSLAHARARRLGKKAMFYARVATALGVASEPVKKPNRVAVAFKKARQFRPNKKQLLTAGLAFVFIGLAATGGLFYQHQQTVKAQAAAKAEAIRAEKANAAAQVCYQQKTDQKQKMLGKITFDQLYDGDACTAAK